MEPKFYPIDPNFTMPRRALSDDIYRAAMESLIIVVADVLFIDRTNKTIYLATRKAKPIQSEWLIGGRLFASEHAVEGLRRIVKRETSLDLAPERLTFLGMNRYLCPDRQQHPQDKGSDSLSFTYIAELSQEERATAAGNLHPDEYIADIGLEEFDMKKLTERNVHPALIDMHRTLFAD